MIKKVGIISPREYKRRVFNHALLECFARIQECCCEINPAEEPRYAEMAKKMSDAFYTDALALNDCTIDQIKKKLSESVTFIQDCIALCENIADCKMKECQDAECDIPEEQKIELSPEDEGLVDKLFDEKSPDLQVDSIRNATVKALVAEDQKAQEIKDALDIAQSQVAAGSNVDAMEEAVTRINGRGPTSLMNAIMNAVSSAAVKDVNENAKAPVSIGKIMSENAKEIKTRAVMLYSLYEASNVFGIRTYTQNDIKKIANDLYYGK